MKDHDEKRGRGTEESGLGRRSWLKIMGAGAAASGLLMGRPKGAGAAFPGAGLIPGRKEPRKLDPGAGLSIILLGTGTPLPNPDRACASTLVIAGDRTFLVDTGREFLPRLAGAGLSDVNMVLFTHYHSDHFAGFGEFMVNRAIQGASAPIKVSGPEGARQVVSSLLAAYSLDNGYRKAHHGDKWSSAAMIAEVSEAEPGVVYDDAGLKITMFEVDHAPVAPAMAYRFDYRGKTVVISGDTKKVPQMIEMAKGCDLLVHESASRRLTETAAAAMNNSKDPADRRLAEMAIEMLTYHTMTEEAAEIARDAGVKKLVLTHMAPNLPANTAVEKIYTGGMSGIYKGPIVTGRDGMEIEA